MKHLGVIIFAVLGVLLGWLTSAVIRSPQGREYLPAVSILVPSPTPTPVPNYPPVRLRVPSLQIDTEVESVGLDQNGAMDVPANSDNVAWYNLGAKPGDQGSAVLAGHYDWYDGPAVFYKLSAIKPGDRIEVEDIYGKTMAFVVKEVADYKEDDFPLADVFGNKDKRRLNLITCSGQYNRSEKNYSHRLVVYTEKAD